MRQPGMTTRRWMIAVAAVAMALGLAVRAYRLQRLASYHEAQAANSLDGRQVVLGGIGPPGTHYVISPRQAAAHYVAFPDAPNTHFTNVARSPGVYKRLSAKGEWHWRMWQKYLRAARRPWFPVPPDPPAPK